MSSAADIVWETLEQAYGTLHANVRGVSLDEALFVPSGGYRSILGTLKHAAGWSHVYRSYAFDATPCRWTQIEWPRALRTTIGKDEAYLEEVISWFDPSHEWWKRDLSGLSEAELSAPRPVHWGGTAPLYRIVAMIAGHHLYHAGELNQILSIVRAEAWEEGEEVEENNVSTLGHTVKPPWMSA